MIILDKKINNVHRNLFIKLLMLVIVFSCNEEGMNPKEQNGNGVILSENIDGSTMVINLSSSKNTLELLCQGWTYAEDVGSLIDMDSNSALDIPYRSFYLSSDNSFVKDPRNTLQFGDWKYDETEKTISLNYSGGKGKQEVYKVVALSFNELMLVKAGDDQGAALRYISSGKQFKNPLD